MAEESSPTGAATAANYTTWDQMPAPLWPWISIQARPSAHGTPHVLFRVESLVGTQPLEPDADGQRFLLSIRLQSVSTVPITVVLNWQVGLKE